MKGIIGLIIAFVGIAFLFWGAMQVLIWLIRFIVSFIMFCLCIFASIISWKDESENSNPSRRKKGSGGRS